MLVMLFNGFIFNNLAKGKKCASLKIVAGHVVQWFYFQQPGKREKTRQSKNSS